MKKLSGEDIAAVTLELIGPTTPVGDSYIDAKISDNLEELIVVADHIFDDLARAAGHANDTWHSSQKVGIEAKKYLTDTADWLRERLEWIERRA